MKDIKRNYLDKWRVTACIWIGDWSRDDPIVSILGFGSFESVKLKIWVVLEHWRTFGKRAVLLCVQQKLIHVNTCTKTTHKKVHKSRFMIQIELFNSRLIDGMNQAELDGIVILEKWNIF